MPQITSSTGLISGIDTGKLTSELIAADAAPVSLLQTRVNSDQTLGSTYQGLGSQLQTLQTAAQSLEKAQTFQATTATSSDPTVLTATTTDGAAVGTYSLQVARTVTTQQLIGTGFTDATSAKVGAGTITIQEGGGSNLATQTPLSALNGGAGAGRGKFRITDRSGASAVIDTTSAVSLDDVVADVNTATTVSVRASVVNNHLVLTDTSGRTTSNLIVQDLGTGTGAADLGIAANAATTTVTGTAIDYLSRTTLLAQLNDGRGVRTGTGGNDFTIKTASGATVAVNLSTVKSVGDAVDAINAAGGGKVTASIPAGSTGLKLVDNTAGGGATSVTPAAGSNAAADLGLLAAPVAKTITGKSVLAGLDTTLLSSLNGGAGLTLGKVAVIDRAGHVQTIDLSAAANVQDVINTINAAGTVRLKASLKPSGNGIQITDVSGGTGNLTIAESGGTTAAQLGIGGTFTAAQTTVAGKDLGRQWLTTNTALSTLNGGKGIDKGQFTITTAAGTSATIDLTGKTVNTVGDVLYQINSKGVAGLTASINATGNGIVLNDASGGAGQLTVTDVNGTAAADLNLKGKAPAGTHAIDGAFVKTIAVSANDTLTTVAAAINGAGAGVQATVISDGSATAPYRLSITSNNSGTAGQVAFDAGSTGLGTQTLVAAQDAAVFVGGAAAAQPLLVTSSSNQVANIIPGVTINLLNVSAGPVQLTIGADADALVKSLGSFTTTFNTLTTSITSQSTYNTSSQSAGLLLGDPVAEGIQSGIFSMINAVVPGTGAYRTLSSIGFTVGAKDQLTFNEGKFRQAFAADPSAVQDLFNQTTSTTAADGTTTTAKQGVAYSIDAALTQLADPVSGSVTQAQKELTTEEQGFTDQIAQLNALLNIKKIQYETQFANLESALATLKAQGTALGAITNIGSGSTTSSSSSSSSG